MRSTVRMSMKPFSACITTRRWATAPSPSAKSLAMNPQWVTLDKSINDQILASFNQKLQQGYDQLRAAQAVMSQVQAQEKEFNKGIDKFDQNLRTSTFDDSWLRTTGGGSSSSGGQLSSTDR